MSKTMKKSRKQLVLSMAACFMVLSMAVGGTMAYMTDSETATNEFTVGKVKIALEEPNYPGNDSEKVNKLVPNEIVKKDPQIKNTGENDAIVFMKVQVPKANITITPTEGGAGTKAIQEIFALKNLKTGDDGPWMEIRKDDATDDKCIYVFGYKTKLTKNATTAPLFDEVQLKNFIEREIDATTQDIIINSYAIQANDIADIDTSELDKKKLDEIYEIYVNQSGDKETNTINYVLNGGTLTGEKKNYTVADYGYVPPTPTKDGAEFLGWTPTSLPVDSVGAITFTAEWKEETTATLLDGETLNKKMKRMAGNDSAKVDNYDVSIQAIRRSVEMPSDTVITNRDSIISTSDSESTIYMWYENGVINWWSDANVVKSGSSLKNVCYYIANLSDISGLADWDTSDATTMESAFGYCASLSNLKPLANWDISNVTTVENMFFMNNITDLSPLSDWNTENITNMCALFGANMSLNNLTPLKSWNTHNVVNMSSMFLGCFELTDITALANWNTGNVQDMSAMFECINYNSNMKLSDISPLSAWNTENVTNMSSMFRNCNNLTDLSGLVNWNTKNVTNMDRMFEGCRSLTDLTGLENWNTKNVETMQYMFGGSSDYHMKLTNLTALKNWDVGNVTNMRFMFGYCDALADASALNNWDITKVTEFTYIFAFSPSHPEFTKRAGTWAVGTFFPAS